MTDVSQCAATWLAPRDPRLPAAVAHLDRACTGLWIAGRSDVLHRGVRIGIVGSRQPRADSAAHARRIAFEAASAGMTIVSGLAMGIDGIAHRGALDAGGTTIAVLAGGLGRVHPARHVALAQEIAGSESQRGVVAGHHASARGAVLSEYGAGSEVSHAWQFQARNRIIAALSDYVVIIQAKPRSGSLGTAEAALNLGVPIGVVPSAPNDECYTGSIELVRDGADSVVDVRSLARRLELHGVMRDGFHEAVARGASVDVEQRGNWLEPSAADEGGTGAVQLRIRSELRDHLRVPRVLDEFAELTKQSLTEARKSLLELEAAGEVALRSDGSWQAT